MNIPEDHTVTSFEELADLVQPFRKDGDWIFRGVRQSNYELIPKMADPIHSSSLLVIGLVNSSPFNGKA